MHTHKISKAVSAILISAIFASLYPAEFIPKIEAASSWNPTLLVNTESFQRIDSGDASTTVDLEFGASTSTLKLLTNGTFQFNKSLSVVGMLSGSRLTVDGNANISGSLVVKNNITARGTISGTTLNANSLLTGSTLQGFGLYNCQGSANKLTYNATTKKFLCEADQTGGAGGNWSNTGSLQSAFDTRYVNTRGDTMTGNLVIRSVSGANAMNLNVIGGISGAKLRVSAGGADIQGPLSVSGSIRTESSVSGAYLTFMGATSSYILGNLGIGKSGTINTKLEVLGTISGARLALYNTAITATGALYVEQRASATGAMVRNMHSESRPVLALDGRGLSGTAAHIVFGYKGTYDTKLFRSGVNTLRTDGAFVARTTVSGANLTFMGATSSYILGNLGVGKSGTINTKLEVVGTISGTTLNANSLLTGSTLQGFGLFNCQGTSNKLTYNATTKKFLCEADQTGTGNWSNTGSLQSAFDTRYVNTRGDTMTGNLVIRSVSGANAMNLNVIGGISGAKLRVSAGGADIQGPLSVSGSIRTESSVSGAYLTFMGATSSYILGNLGIGKSTTPNTKLEVVGTISGSRLSISNNASVSGSLTVEGSTIIGSGTGLTTAQLNIKSNGYNALSFYGNTQSGSAKGGLIIGARQNNALTAFAGFGLWDNGVHRGAYIGGGNWNAPDATRLDFYAADAYDETLGTVGNIRARIDRSGLSVFGTVTGTTLNATSLLTGSTLQGFGLFNCQGTANKLTYNASTKKFLCEADQTGGSGGNWSNTGSLQSAFDRRFVNIRGDTMTGNLVIRSTSGTTAVNLNVAGTMSGRNIVISGTGFAKAPLIFGDAENNSVGFGTSTPDKNSVATFSGATAFQGGRSDPAAPGTGGILVYGKSVNGRMMLKAKGPSGVDYPYQPSFFQNSIAMINASQTTTLNAFAVAITTTTTISHVFDERIGYMANFATTAVANNTSGVISAQAFIRRGSIANGANGFFWSARVGLVQTGSIRVFAGMSDQATMVIMAGSDNPAGSRIAFSYSTNRGDTTWKVSTKDGTTENLVDTGMSARPTAPSTFDLFLYTPPFGTPNAGKVFWRIDNVSAGTTAEGNTSSNLPAGTTTMRLGLGVSAVTTTAANFRMNRIYFEADR